LLDNLIAISYKSKCYLLDNSGKSWCQSFASFDRTS